MPQLFGGQVPSSTFMEPEDAGEQIIAVPMKQQNALICITRIFTRRFW